LRVLLTGSEGKIGRYVEVALIDAGHRVTGFDLRSGQDVRDGAAVSRAAAACDAIVHLAAILPPGDSGNSSELMGVNLLGTWNVLRAAREHEIGRIVFFSSVNALGIFMGNREPDYLPIDDFHPSYPRTPYSISKRLAEEMCRFHTEETGAVTVCLRPPLVVAPDEYQTTIARWEQDPGSEWQPFWEYGAFLDVRDAASAAVAALTRPRSGHITTLLCADDIAATRPSRDLVDQLLRDIPWKDTDEYAMERYRALVSTARAKEVLRWQPRHRWRPLAAG
jgi:nucleoside-diphosphate-sugar epimerase